MSDRPPSGFGRGRLAALMANQAAESGYRDGSSDKTEDILPKQGGRGQLLHSVMQAAAEPKKASIEVGARGRGRLLDLGSAGSDLTPPKSDSAIKSFEQMRLSDKSDTWSGERKASLTSSSGIQEPPLAPKGRGRLSALLQTVKSEQTVSDTLVPQVDTAIPVGRGSRLAPFASSSESSSDKQPRLLAKHPGQLDRYAEEQSVISSHRPNEQQVAQQQQQVEEEFPAPEVGTAGRPIKALTNYVRLKVQEDKGVYEYEVRYEPNIHSNQLRYQLLNQHLNIIGRTRLFDGTTLSLPFQIAEKITVLESSNENDGSTVKLTIQYKRKKRFGECKPLYGNLFDKIMKVLKFVRFTTKNFDPTEPRNLPQWKLEIWPGFVTAVEETVDGVMLCVDVTHRVLSKQTVLDVMIHAYRSAQGNMDSYKQSVLRALMGAVILTRYNQKTYRIDDIDFVNSPSTTFDTKDGKKYSYAEYYKNQYGITLKDMKQPLLISRKQVRVSATETKELVIALMPEISYMTGLTDDHRKDFKVMKDIAVHTRITPNARQTELLKFCKRVNGNEECKKILSDWGLELDDQAVGLDARQLPGEKVDFAKGKSFPIGDNGDFSKYIGNNEMLTVVHLTNWLIIHPKNVQKELNSFIELMQRNARPMGVQVAQPTVICLNDDRTETVASTLRTKLTASTQIVVLISQSLKGDLYATIKKICCAETPIPSQVINARTLSNDAKNRSIVQKIALQMNCKLGGSLWAIKIPLENTMICGIDTYHDTGAKSNSVSAFVASINSNFTKWYSKAIVQNRREELGHGLMVSVEAALGAYKNANNKYPDRIVIYRDGVGDGQLKACEDYEIKQLKDACSSVDECYEPKITFVVVQKRINVRFFKNVGGKAENPDPGSVLDTTVTKKGKNHSFYLVPQSVRNATCTPVHYIVLLNEAGIKIDHLQRITYKLCYMYYNWPGAVRVPACVQYSHKLAALVGESMKRNPAESLSEKLYFL